MNGITGPRLGFLLRLGTRLGGDGDLSCWCGGDFRGTLPNFSRVELSIGELEAGSGL